MQASVGHGKVAYRPLDEEAAEAMGVLAWLLRSGNAHKLRKAKPIVFDFLTVRWHFDPAARDYVVKGDYAGAALCIYTRPEVLVRLLRESGYRPTRREIALVGDKDALTPIADSLKGNQNVLALRAQKVFGD